MRAKLDMIHAVQCTIQGKAYTSVTWGHVVEVCRSSHVSFAALAGVPEDPAGATNPPVMAPMATPPLAAPVAAVMAFSMSAHVTCSYRSDACFKVDHPCKL